MKLSLWSPFGSLLLALALPLALPLAGCIEGEPAASGPSLPPALPTTEVSQQLEDCGFACGDNGGGVDGVFFWELNLAGLPNSKNVRYVRAARSELDMLLGHFMRLDVEGARLVGSDPLTGVVQGLALTGAILEVWLGTARYYIKIAEVHTDNLGEPYWTRSQVGTSERVETYRLRWAKAPPPDVTVTPFYQDLCTITTPPDEPWQNQLDALVFEGERYDIDSKAITPSDSAPRGTTWFNVACAGSLPAKMHLTRRTSAASNAGPFRSTIADDRQAMARMWAADYCGTGEPFTVTGHKLRVRDRKSFTSGNDGWLPAAAPVGFSKADTLKLGFSYEAVWDASGAVCLDTPRLEDRAEIETACGFAIPTCSSQAWFPDSWKSHGQLLSANPPVGIIIAP